MLILLSIIIVVDNFCGTNGCILGSRFMKINDYGHFTNITYFKTILDSFKENKSFVVLCGDWLPTAQFDFKYYKIMSVDQYFHGSLQVSYTRFKNIWQAYSKHHLVYDIPI